MIIYVMKVTKDHYVFNVKLVLVKLVIMNALSVRKFI